MTTDSTLTAVGQTWVSGDGSYFRQIVEISDDDITFDAWFKSDGNHSRHRHLVEDWWDTIHEREMRVLKV